MFTELVFGHLHIWKIDKQYDIQRTVHRDIFL